MYKKQLEQLVTVGLKYFFDLDFHSFIYGVITVLAVLGMGRFLVAGLFSAFHDGLLMVKKDLSSIKSDIAAYKDRVASHMAQG